MHSKPLLPIILFVLLTWSCSDNDSVEFPEGKVEAYAPVYIDESEIHNIELREARQLNNPGKIYVYGDYLLVNERYEGIHVIDNSNPAQPVILYFISIPGNIDMSIKQDVIYADNFADLVLIKINDEGVSDIKREVNIFPNRTNQRPPEHGHFKCIDASRGEVVGWEKRIIEKPECYY